MPGYTELFDGYDFTTSENGQEGQRVFIEQSGGSDDLPVIGEAFKKSNGDILTRVRCREVKERFFKQQTNTVLQFVCIYHTRPTDLINLNIGGKPSDRDIPRRWTIGGEILKTGKKSGWYWETAGDEVDQPLYLRIVHENITREVITPKYEQMRTVCHGLYGKVNNATFEGLDAGRVLYIGSDVTEFNNSAGDQVYRFEHHFSSRIATRETGNHKDGWNHIWNEASGDWDVPNKSQGGSSVSDRIHPEGDFETLFTVSVT